MSVQTFHDCTNVQKKDIISQIKILHPFISPTKSTHNHRVQRIAVLNPTTDDSEDGEPTVFHIPLDGWFESLKRIEVYVPQGHRVDDAVLTVNNATICRIEPRQRSKFCWVIPFQQGCPFTNTDELPLLLIGGSVKMVVSVSYTPWTWIPVGEVYISPKLNTKSLAELVTFHLVGTIVGKESRELFSVLRPKIFFGLRHKNGQPCQMKDDVLTIPKHIFGHCPVSMVVQIHGFVSTLKSITVYIKYGAVEKMLANTYYSLFDFTQSPTGLIRFNAYRRCGSRDDEGPSPVTTTKPDDDEQNSQPVPFDLELLDHDATLHFEFDNDVAEVRKCTIIFEELNVLVVENMRVALQHPHVVKQ